MNRNEEYKKLLQELAIPNPAAEHTLTRARARKRRRKWIIRPALSLVCVLACFVLLINVSAPAASACSRIPVLKELTELLLFNRFNQSMKTAIENDYVQTLNLQQTDNGITVYLDYVIADQRQVNIFYHVTRENHEEPAPDKLQITSVEFYLENGEKARASTMWNNDLTELSGINMRTLTVDFYDEDAAVPAVLFLKMNIAGFRIPEEDDSFKTAPSDDEILASFEFNIHFDPQFYNTEGKILKINQDFVLDNQKFTLTSVEIHPTYLQFNLESASENRLWLKGLTFHLTNEKGEAFESKNHGISSLGAPDSPEFLSYRAESPWFYDAESLRLTLTGAVWKTKDSKNFLLNLKTGKTEGQPDFVRNISITQEDEGKIIAITSTPFHNGGILSFSCYDAEGDCFSTNKGATLAGEGDQLESWLIYLPKDYTSDLLYLSADQDSEWSGEVSLNFDINK